MPSLVEIGPLVLKKKLNNVKSQHTDGQTDRSTFGRKELDGQSDSHIYNSALCFQGCIIIYHELYNEKKLCLYTFYITGGN